VSSRNPNLQLNFGLMTLENQVSVSSRNWSTLEAPQNFTLENQVSVSSRNLNHY